VLSGLNFLPRRPYLYVCLSLPKDSSRIKRPRPRTAKCEWYIYGAPKGYRERHWYHDKKAAKQAAEDRNAELAAFGSNLSLADAHRLEAAECIKRLLPFNKSLTDGTNFYLKHLNNQKTSITVQTLEVMLRSVGHWIIWAVPTHDVPSDPVMAYDGFVRAAMEMGEKSLARVHRRFLEEWKHFVDLFSRSNL
jgi:hypothetical protein